MGRNPSSEKQKPRKGLWSPEEDQKLFNHISTYGVGCWSAVPKQTGLQRCGKSCRLRWINYLRPDIKRGTFSQEEEDVIVSLHKILGNRWSQIASQLPGRTDNEIKNFWNSALKKKLKNEIVNPEIQEPTTENENGVHQEDAHVSKPKDSSRRSYRRSPIFDPFRTIELQQACNPICTDPGLNGGSDWSTKGLQCNSIPSSGFPSHNSSAVDATDSSSNGDNSSSNNSAVALERNIEDFLQLIHNNCSEIQEEQEQEMSRIISGSELDRESEPGFF